jgi:hypothetical protein
VKLTDIMMWLDILIDFDGEPLLGEGVNVITIYTKSRVKVRKYRRGAIKLKRRTFKVAGEIFVIQKFKLVSRPQEYTGSEDG